MIGSSQREQIAHSVIKVLVSRFNNFPDDATPVRNAPFHRAYLNAFENKLMDKVSSISDFLSLSSWLQGINTTLGQTFFEEVANILSGGKKRSFTGRKNTRLKRTNKQRDVVNEILQSLRNDSTTKSNLARETNLLIEANKGTSDDALNFTADVFIERGDEIFAIELKSVQPNSGEIQGEKRKILEAKAALIHEYPNKTIHFYIGFPFDPNSSSLTEPDKSSFLNDLVTGSKYLDSDEILLGSELWNFLSGHDNTMEEILKIIKRIATPDFIDKYNRSYAVGLSRNRG